MQILHRRKKTATMWMWKHFNWAEEKLMQTFFFRVCIETYHVHQITSERQCAGFTLCCIRVSIIIHINNAICKSMLINFSSIFNNEFFRRIGWIREENSSYMRSTRQIHETKQIILFAQKISYFMSTSIHFSTQHQPYPQTIKTKRTIDHT